MAASSARFGSRFVAVQPLPEVVEPGSLGGAFGIAGGGGGSMRGMPIGGNPMRPPIGIRIVGPRGIPPRRWNSGPDDCGDEADHHETGDEALGDADVPDGRPQLLARPIAYTMISSF